VNSADTITTAQTLDEILAQVQTNQIALPAAIKANQDATTGTEAEQGTLAVEDLLSINPVAAVATSSSVEAAASTASAKKGNKGGKKNGRAFNA